MLIINKDLRKFNVIKKLVAGICLNGGEAKSIRENKFSFKNSYVDVQGEAILKNFQIKCEGRYFKKFDEKRDRRLLLKKNEILRLRSWARLYKAIVLVESVENREKKIKFNIALAQKNKFEKKKKFLIEKINNKHKKIKMMGVQL